MSRLLYIAKPKLIGGYGRLYNNWAVYDSRNLANTGWQVMTIYDIINLSNYLGGDYVSGGKLKEIGLEHWLTPNTGATNAVLFNLRGGGYREQTGVFSSLKYLGTLGLKHGIANWTFKAVEYTNDDLNIYNTWDNRVGLSTRVVNLSPTLSNGQTGTYTCNDGQVQNTIVINGIEWLSENLKETRWRDGTLIPVVTDNAAWTALTTGARCAYNNDESNV